MDNYKRLSVRFNTDRSDHKKAWDIFSSLPNGTMNEFITSSIINNYNEKQLKRMIRECMHEVLEGYSLNIDVDMKGKNRNKEEHTAKQNLDNDALDFIKNL